MNIEQIREYTLSLPGVTEDQAFGEDILNVFLVDGVLKYQTLVDYFGSYTWVEITLLLMVILPTWAVYEFTKEK